MEAMSELVAEPTSNLETTTVLTLDVGHLITEDDTPVDNFLTEKNQRLLTEPLYSSRPPDLRAEKFLVAANVGVYYALREPAIVPDVFLSLDVQAPEEWSAKERRCYMLWEFGKPPEVAIEIVSNTIGEEEGDKRRVYARIGVEYYVVFDPYRHLSDNLLTVYERRSGNYTPINRPWFFEGVGLGVGLWHGVFEGQRAIWLRWYDHNGQPIPTGAELAVLERQRAEQEHERAEQEHERAEQAQQRADQETAARLAAEAELVRLRVELERLRGNQV